MQDLKPSDPARRLQFAANQCLTLMDAVSRKCYMAVNVEITPVWSVTHTLFEPKNNIYCYDCYLGTVSLHSALSPFTKNLDNYMTIK